VQPHPLEGRRPKKRLRKKARRRSALRLAAHFLRPDVDQFLSELTADQFAEWEAFFSLEEAGGLRDDLRAAKIVCAIYNTALGRGPNAPTVRPQDVFETLAGDPLAPQSEAEMMGALGAKAPRKR
jgi:hypothetical protein